MYFFLVQKLDQKFVCDLNCDNEMIHSSRAFRSDQSYQHCRSKSLTCELVGPQWPCLFVPYYHLSRLYLSIYTSGNYGGMYPSFNIIKYTFVSVFCVHHGQIIRSQCGLSMQDTQRQNHSGQKTWVKFFNFFLGNFLRFHFNRQKLWK